MVQKQPFTAPFSVDLSGHAAIVTGAGTGVARATALALGRAGCKVQVNDINPLNADSVAEEIIAAGGQAQAWQADIANRFQVSALIESARDAFGRVDILVNGASVLKTETFAKLDEWDWRRVMDVNVNGAFFATQLFGRVLADEGGGVIVNIATTPSPIKDAVSYVASKAALVGLTKQSAVDLAPFGVRVNAVCVANIPEENEADASAVPNNALQRHGTLQDASDVILFLCSDASRFITGQAIHVDGGEAFA